MLKLSAFVLLAILGLPAAARGQEPPRITVRAIGGLMGFSEGFCENPGGTYDWPSGARPLDVQQLLHACLARHIDTNARWLGGAIGAERLLRSRATSERDWLVLAPNNTPVIDRGTDAARKKENDSENAVFLRYLRALHADAVALGGEDFDRLLRGSAATAKNILDWVGLAQIPLLASNAAIKTTGAAAEAALATQNGISIHLEDETVGWNDRLVLDVPDAKEVDVALEEAPKCSATPEQRVPAALGDPDRTTDHEIAVKPRDGFRPETCYWLRVATPRGDATFRFRSDAALTPFRSGPRSLEGFPAVSRAAGSLANAVAVALVDPGVRARARAEAWSWTSGAGSKDKHELVFRDPVDILKLIVRRASLAGADGKTGTAPIVILVSALTDEQTLKVISEFPEIRFVVLPAGSTVLGIASRRSDDRPVIRPPAVRYSGDLGFVSVVDGLYPEAARTFMRPEWAGETEIITSAEVSAHGLMQNFQTNVIVVPGAPLAWRAGTGHDIVYVAKDPVDATLPFEEVVGTAPRYADCNGRTDDCAAFYKLWEDPAGLTAAAALSLRKSLGADLSAVSSGLVDPDFRLWVEDRIADGNGDATWLSRFVLKRLLYGSPRMVRAFVSGADLPDTLQKILDDDEENCISGLGDGCTRPGKDHPEQLNVNGRRIDSRLIYSIVLPDALAQSLDLQHDDDADIVDLVDTTDVYLHRQLPAEDELSASYRGYFAVPTLSVGYSRADPSEDNAGVRANLPVGFAGAKKSRNLTLSIDADLAVIDARRWAVRFPATLDYTRQNQDDVISYEKDEFSAGGRIDVKIPIFVGELRPFAGLFVDGPVSDHLEALTANDKPEGVDVDFFKTAAFDTAYMVEPSRYRHWAVGADVGGLKTYSAGVSKFTVTNFGARWTEGHLTRSPYGVAIDGRPADDTLQGTFLREGPQRMLSDYFIANPSVFSKNTTLQLLTRRLDQRRLQADLVLAIELTRDDTTYKGEFTVQYRRYFYESEATATSFLLHDTQKYEAKLDIPIWRRLSATPKGSYERAAVVSNAYTPFTLWTLDISASFPLSWRWGQGHSLR